MVMVYGYSDSCNGYRSVMVGFGYRVVTVTVTVRESVGVTCMMFL